MQPDATRLLKGYHFSSKATVESVAGDLAEVASSSKTVPQHLFAAILRGWPFCPWRQSWFRFLEYDRDESCLSIAGAKQINECRIKHEIKCYLTLESTVMLLRLQREC
jgi:hypothetical protein